MILGAGGQLGTELTRVFSDCETTALRHEDCDVSDYESVMSAAYACGPELVLNASAMNRVDDCETERDTAFAVNAVGPRNLALAARRLGATLVHVSTDYVFDGAGAPYDEWAAPDPISEYGRSKLAGEVEASRSLPECYVVRTAVVFGASGRNFARTMLDLARGSEAPVDVVDDVVGSPTHAGYLAEAIRRLAVSGRFGLYHVAGGGACSRADLARAVFVGAGQDPSRVRGVPSTSRAEAARRPLNSALEGRAWRLAGFAPVPPWEEHVDRLLRELGVSVAPARVPAPGFAAAPVPDAQTAPPPPAVPAAPPPAEMAGAATPDQSGPSIVLSDPVAVPGPAEAHPVQLPAEAPLSVALPPVEVPAPGTPSGGVPTPMPLSEEAPPPGVVPAPASRAPADPLPGLPGLGGPGERTQSDSPPADAGDSV